MVATLRIQPRTFICLRYIIVNTLDKGGDDDDDGGDITTIR